MKKEQCPQHGCHQLAIKDHDYSKGDPDYSYLYERLKSFKPLGLDVPDKPSEFSIDQIPSFEFRNLEHQLFSADENGDIILFYYNYLGNHVQWLKPGTKNKRPFFRKRLKQEKADQKYWQPPSSGEHPYITTSVLEKCSHKIKIESLILVEGEFKAFAGNLQGGLNIIGLPSNRVPGEPNGPKGKLHEDILEIIKLCKVENIYLLLDADVLNINPSPDKDTSKRQESLYRSVLNFRQGLEEIYYSPDTHLKNIYFTHIKEQYADTHKGLDDLLIGHGKI